MSEGKRTSVIFHSEDVTAIDEIKEKFGLSNDIDAVRLSLRVVSESDLTINQEQVEEIIYE